MDSKPVAWMHRDGGAWELSFVSDDGSKPEGATQCLPLVHPAPEAAQAGLSDAEIDAIAEVYYHADDTELADIRCAIKMAIHRLTRASAANVDTCPGNPDRVLPPAPRAATVAEPSDIPPIIYNGDTKRDPALRARIEQWGEQQRQTVDAAIDRVFTGPQAAPQQAKPSNADGYTVEEIIRQFEAVHGAGSVRDYVAKQQAEPAGDEIAKVRATLMQLAQLCNARGFDLIENSNAQKFWYANRDDAHAAVDSLDKHIAAQSGQRAGVVEVPDGYVAVPLHPTPAQTRAGQLGVTTTCANAIYAAMLAAAPTPAAQEGDDRDA